MEMFVYEFVNNHLYISHHSQPHTKNLICQIMNIIYRLTSNNRSSSNYCGAISRQLKFACMVSKRIYI